MNINNYNPDYFDRENLITAFRNLSVDIQLVATKIEIENDKIFFSIDRLTGNEKKAFLLFCKFVDVCYTFIQQLEK